MRRSYLPEYVTWIPTTSYDLQEDATVYDLYTKAIGEAGLRSIGEENDYVRTIYAPSCLGGYALSEFTNGVLPFTDVREADWFYDDVVYAYENGLFSGTSDTTFSPNASMTRAMLVTVLYRLEGQPTVSGRSGFSDVKLNSYYEDAVTWAADNGIVNGTGATTFSPNANVTREQMAAILYRYAQYKQYGTTASAGLNGFSDAAKVSAYAKAPLSWAVAEKLVNGSEGRLLPTGNATRAQVAAILHRFVENVAKTTA